MRSEIVLILTEEANQQLLSKLDEKGKLFLKHGTIHFAPNLVYKRGEVVSFGPAEYRVETYKVSDKRMKDEGLVHRHRVTLRKISGDGLDTHDFANLLISEHDSSATERFILYHWKDMKWGMENKGVFSIITVLHRELDENTYKFLISEECSCRTQIGSLDNTPFQAFIYVNNGIRFFAGNSTLLVHYSFCAAGYEYAKIALLEVTETDTKEDVIHRYFQDYFGSDTSVEERGKKYFSRNYHIRVQSAEFISEEDAAVLRKYL